MIEPNKENRDIFNPEIEDAGETQLRPRYLSDFIGQKQSKESLSVFIQATKGRGTALDHVLLYGPPGLGKTTMAQIIARELGVNIRVSSGPNLSKPGSLAAILTNLQPHDVLFIDEIHRLAVSVEETLYPAMEDFCIDAVVGEGPSARILKIPVPKFTLIGATTRPGMLSGPLRDRFGIPLRLQFYEIDELEAVLKRNAALLNINITQEAAHMLATCSRGTPRIAIRLLKRVRDFAEVAGEKEISLASVRQAFHALEIDNLGLDSLDRRYIGYILEHYKGGPVGVESIAAGMSEDRDTLEDTIEPHLMHIGFLTRTSRGRMLTQKAMDYMRQKHGFV
ncbi:MAG: Holliday junction branch migration DNA helicase RuvB [Proteobacteria bacterium]|nr:Holliday junction branch migration DNA helicase RuvB [Pseudomonadota bacterium]